MQAHKVPVVPGLVWDTMTHDGLTIKAAQLQHRLPCWGYVMEEEAGQQHQPGRKVVLLGDTCDSQAIAGALRTNPSKYHPYKLPSKALMAHANTHYYWPAVDVTHPQRGVPDKNRCALLRQ